VRILFATAHKYLPEIHGGMEVNTHQLAVALGRLGHAVGVVAGLKGRGFTGLRARARMKFLGNPCPADHGLGYPVWRSTDSPAVVERVAAAFRPDVVVLQGGADFIELLRRFLALDAPVVGYLHSGDRLPLDEELRRHPRLCFIANSNFTASLHPEKTMRGIIPPIVPRELYATQSDRSAAVFVNPAPYKGLDTVMALAKARPDAPFLFVVNGMPTLPPPRALLPANIRVIGPVKDMKEVYAKAKVILAPSQVEETWGRIATEAHISGIPVLASTRGGLPEAVGPGGLCLPADAPAEDWIASFGRLWDDPATYNDFAAAAFQYSLRPEIQPETIVKSFSKILETAMTAGRAGTSKDAARAQ
jgi:glycosyltransferase involved in cell wall biosynthesis